MIGGVHGRHCDGFIDAGKGTVNTMLGYIGDKLNLPLSEINKDKLRGSLAGREVPTEETEHFISFMETCEFAQFAPSASAKGLQEVYEEAVEAITRMDKFV